MTVQLSFECSQETTGRAVTNNDQVVLPWDLVVSCNEKQ